MGENGPCACENHINKNPLFENSSEGKFQLQPESPVIDKGAKSILILDGSLKLELKAPENDIEDTKRNCGENLPDMGAYEFCSVL